MYTPFLKFQRYDHFRIESNCAVFLYCTGPRSVPNPAQNRGIDKKNPSEKKNPHTRNALERFTSKYVTAGRLRFRPIDWPTSLRTKTSTIRAKKAFDTSERSASLCIIYEVYQ